MAGGIIAECNVESEIDFFQNDGTVALVSLAENAWLAYMPPIEGSKDKSYKFIRFDFTSGKLEHSVFSKEAKQPVQNPLSRGDEENFR